MRVCVAKHSASSRSVGVIDIVKAKRTAIRSTNNVSTESRYADSNLNQSPLNDPAD